MRGINDHEIPDFVDIAKNKEIDVRFIEAMPFNGYDGNDGLFMDYTEMLDVIQKLYPTIKKDISVPTKSASIRYNIPGFKGSIGLIPAFSRTLCGNCNRIRVTAKGILMNCLYSSNGMDVRALLKEALIPMRSGWLFSITSFPNQIDGHATEANRGHDNDFQSMTTIGG